MYPTVPFVKSVYAVPITELDGNVRLEDGVAVLVPLARIKRTETVSVLLDCFCCETFVQEVQILCAGRCFVVSLP